MIVFWVAIVTAIVLIIAACGTWLLYGWDLGKKFHMVASIVVAIVLVVLVLWGGWAYRTQTQSGQRMIKSWESETSGGIDRTVRVYAIDGQLIEQYEGRFDVVDDEKSIIFDDEDGKRHILYNTTGTVIVDEK